METYNENQGSDQGTKTMRIQRKPKPKTQEQMDAFMSKCLTARRQKILERAETKATNRQAMTNGSPVPPCPSPDDNETIKYLTKDESSDEDEAVKYEKRDTRGDNYLTNLIIPKTRMTRSSRVNFNLLNDDEVRIYK